jgi:hypothetical protein
MTDLHTVVAMPIDGQSNNDAPHAAAESGVSTLHNTFLYFRFITRAGFGKGTFGVRRTQTVLLHIRMGESR